MDSLKLLFQQMHFQKIITLIALIFFISRLIEKRRVTKIVLNLADDFFFNIFTLLQEDLGIIVFILFESRTQAKYCWTSMIRVYLMNFLIEKICSVITKRFLKNFIVSMFGVKLFFYQWWLYPKQHYIFLISHHFESKNISI